MQVKPERNGTMKWELKINIMGGFVVDLRKTPMTHAFSKIFQGQVGVLNTRTVSNILNN